MSNSYGTHKGSDRKVVRSFVTGYGLAATLGLFFATLTEKVAGSRGRSTLEERPYHFARRGLTAAIKTIPRAERTEANINATDKKAARQLLEAWGPAGIVEMLSAVTTNESKAFHKCLEDAASEIETATEKLAERRSMFKSSKKAVVLGLAEAPEEAK